MPRKARIVIPDFAHHVIQRGNRRQRVFFKDSDRELYLEHLKTFSEKYPTSVLSYCLMTNHVHLVVVPKKKENLHLLFKSLHSRYAHTINKRQGWSGHLWQARFFSSPLDTQYLRSAVRYTETNPVKANIVHKAKDYKWSSIHERLGESENNILDLQDRWNKRLPKTSEWIDFLEQQENEEITKTIRDNSRKNAPCGSEAFLNWLKE